MLQVRRCALGHTAESEKHITDASELWDLTIRGQIVGEEETMTSALRIGPPASYEDLH
jgi:hypothetical protein